MRFQPTYPQKLDPGPDWPLCRYCQVAMNYLNRLPATGADDQSVLLFQCCENPGACMDWEADGGGTHALLADAPVVAAIEARVNAGDASNAYAARGVAAAGSHYGTALRQYRATHPDLPPRHLLGQLGGTPDWVQGIDATPDCDRCGQPMRFIAQLEGRRYLSFQLRRRMRLRIRLPLPNAGSGQMVLAVLNAKSRHPD